MIGMWREEDENSKQTYATTAAILSKSVSSFSLLTFLRLLPEVPLVLLLRLLLFGVIIHKKIQIYLLYLSIIISLSIDRSIVSLSLFWCI